MKLKKNVQLALKGSDLEFKKRLAFALGVSMQTLYRLINKNSDDLTKLSSVILIRELTQLEDSEIFETPLALQNSNSSHNS